MMRRRTTDPRDAPAYSLPEVAAYLDLATSTLRSWVTAHELIVPARPPAGLSFHNLVEAHVLGAMRFQHRFSMREVTLALAYVRDRLGVQRPLLDERFQTDGVSLFVERYNRLVNVSREGQLGLPETLSAYLRRIDRDPKGVPIRLFPVLDNNLDSRPIAIDPRLSFGRPVIANSAIATSIVAERHRAGESVRDLADDYGLTEEQVDVAIRYEAAKQAA